MQTRSSKQIVTLYSSYGYIRILFVPHGVVDVQDLIVLAEHLFEEVPPAE